MKTIPLFRCFTSTFWHEKRRVRILTTLTTLSQSSKSHQIFLIFSEILKHKQFLTEVTSGQLFMETLISYFFKYLEHFAHFLAKLIEEKLAETFVSSEQ